MKRILEVNLTILSVKRSEDQRHRNRKRIKYIILHTTDSLPRSFKNILISIYSIVISVSSLVCKPIVPFKLVIENRKS